MIVALKCPSTQWRIAGKIEKGGEARVVLSGAQWQNIIPVMMAGYINGMQVTTYSGGVKETICF